VSGGGCWLAHVELPVDERESVDSDLCLQDALDGEVELVERGLAEHALADRLVRRLMTIPGVGYLGAGSGGQRNSWFIFERVGALDVHKAQVTACVRVPDQARFEAAQSAARAGSPDRDYYRQAAERLGANRACLAVARKLLKRSYHTLRELGEEALQPA